MDDEVKPEPLWGLWRNGWCSLYPKDGNVYAGSRTDAERAKEVFASEGNDPNEYKEMPFDSGRDPFVPFVDESDPYSVFDDPPTPRQMDALNYIERMGTINRADQPPNWLRTVRAIFFRGWVTGNFDENGYEVRSRPVRLTRIGRQVTSSAKACAL